MLLVGFEAEMLLYFLFSEADDVAGCFYNLLFERWPNRSISKLRKFVKNIHSQIAHVNMNMVQKLNFVTDP